MRIITTLLLVHLTFLGTSQITDSTNNPVTVTSYNSIYKGYTAGGMIFSDTANNTKKEFFSCCYDNKAVMYYNFKTYHDNGKVKLDSTISMMAKRRAEILVREYNSNGKIVYLKKLSTGLDKNRTQLPKRANGLWSGKIVFFREHKKSKQRVKEIRQ